MIARPTTDVLLLDCCRELTDEILPALTDDTLKVRLFMTLTVLENAAVRAKSEIAEMRAETEQLVTFAESVAAAHEDENISTALTNVANGPRASLLLRDVVDVYERAGRAFDAAVHVAHRVQDADLLARAAALLRARVDTEKAVMASYAIVGR